MKKLIMLVILVSGIFSCNSRQEFFEISGEIKNANGEKLYLTELQSNDVLILDSIILNDKGVFSFKGQTDIPKFYALRTSQNNYITLLVNPYEKIVINTDGRNLAEKSIIIGSPESEKIAELRLKQENSIEKLDSLGNYYTSLIGTAELNKVKESLKNESEEIIKEHVNFTKDFILDNYSSMISLMALYQQIAPRRYVLNPTDDIDYFNLVDSALMATIPESEAVRTLHAQMEEFRRQLSASEEINEVTGIGIHAPDIALPNPSGDTIALSSLRGKYVLVDFWASWCRPCRIENPNLVKSYKKYHEKGFEIYQVSLDKKKEHWVEAIEKDQLDWVHVSDLKFWNSSAAQLYKVQSIPASFLLDKQGRIIAKNLRGDILEAKLSEIYD